MFLSRLRLIADSRKDLEEFVHNRLKGELDLSCPIDDLSSSIDIITDNKDGSLVPLPYGDKWAIHFDMEGSASIALFFRLHEESLNFDLELYVAYDDNSEDFLSITREGKRVDKRYESPSVVAIEMELISRFMEDVEDHPYIVQRVNEVMYREALREYNGLIMKRRF